MSGAVEVSKFAVDDSVSQDVRVNVAFRFDNIPPIAISFPDVAAGSWQHVPGIILTEDNHNGYQDHIKRLLTGLVLNQYQDDERMLKEMTAELVDLQATGNTTPNALVQTAIADPDGARRLTVERIQQLNEDISKARERLVSGNSRLEGILHIWKSGTTAV